MRHYWAFYWPLALTASLMLVGLQVFIAVLARYPDGETQLAVFAYAMGVFFVFDVTTAFLPQLVTVFARSAPARRQVMRFCLAIGFLLTLPVAFIAFSASGELLLARAMHNDLWVMTRNLPRDKPGGSLVRRRAGEGARW